MSTGLAALTLINVLISLIGIVSGLVVTYGLLRSQRRDSRTALFLITTVAQRFGILLPISQAAVLAHPRRHFAGETGIRHRRPLQISTRGCLATSLLRH